MAHERDGPGASHAGPVAQLNLRNADQVIAAQPPKQPPERAAYVLTLVPLPGVDATRGLRWLLKTAWRIYGLKCTDAREVRRSGRGESPDYDATDDINKSVAEGFRAIRERKAAGGKGWGES